MTTPVWQSGTLYNPGAIVQRSSLPPVIAVPPTNAGFESGDTGWTKGTGWTITTTGDIFAGSWSATFDFTGTSDILNDTFHPVTPGMSITAKCQVQQGASSAGQAGGAIFLKWYDASEVLISTSTGNIVNSGSGGAWHQSMVTAVAPVNAAFVKVGATYFRLGGGDDLWLDAFSWNYAFQQPLNGLVFTAVQPDAGFSGATEPAWPDTLGEQVVDNEVIWEAINTSVVTWEANPILVSDYFEPDFPEFVGGTVADGTIVWRAVSRRVSDERCPNTAIVAIAASKIFCADDDIIAFSATVNALDWSTTDDAGYLPFGLQTYGANPVAALGLYRSNLVAFNSQAFQMWQVDQDPANMALLDAVPIACTEPRSVQPVQNDLVFLSAVGIRNIGIAGASTNLQAGTFGENIDPLVLAQIRAGVYEPLAAYIPGLGQYWLFFGPQAFVLSIATAKSMSWSRYLFPEAITDTTLHGNDLYLRTNTHKVWKLSDLIEGEDDVAEASPTANIMFGYSGSGNDAGVLFVNVEGASTVDASIPDTGSNTYPSGIVAVGDVWVAVTGGKFYRSVDAGVTWTLTHTDPSGFGDFWGLAFDGDSTIVSINQSDGTPFVSTDTGLTWTSQTPIASFNPDYTIYSPDAGLFISTDDNKCFTSPTGVTWTEQTVPFGGEPSTGGGFAIIWNSDDVNYRLAWSTDGIVWTAHDTGIENFMLIEAEVIVYNDDEGHWIVGERDRMLTTKGAADPPDPTSTWSTFLWPADAVDNGNQICGAFSPGNGTIWTFQNAGGDDLIYQNTDDTFAGWALLENVGSVAPGVGLFVSSASFSGGAGSGTPFEGVIQWPHLDFGALGVTKMMIGLDLVSDAPEGVDVQVLYDQTNLAAITAAYTIDADTLPGQLIPFPVSGPSFAIRLTFAGSQAWEWQACNMYIQDLRTGS